MARTETAKRLAKASGIAMWRLRLVLALAVVVASTTQVGAAREGGGRILTPAAGTTVRAGDVVKISWTRVPADVDEFELLLSVDGGRTFLLRLTEMLDPDLTSYSWRVPNLPTDVACLRLRVGEDDQEVMLRPGPVFELASDTKAPIGRITFQSGEWWPTDSIAASPHDVEVEPRMSDPEPREDGSVTALVFPPQRSDVRAPESLASLGHDGAIARCVPPAASPNGDHTPLLFLPKRE